MITSNGARMGLILDLSRASICLDSRIPLVLDLLSSFLLLIFSKKASSKFREEVRKCLKQQTHKRFSYSQSSGRKSIIVYHPLSGISLKMFSIQRTNTAIPKHLSMHFCGMPKFRDETSIF